MRHESCAPSHADSMPGKRNFYGRWHRVRTFGSTGRASAANHFQGKGRAVMTGQQRLLIAEDDLPISANLCTFLEGKGFRVDAVYNGQAAMHRCSVERFDLVLLDIGLPGLDGLSVLQRLRVALASATPVLVLSARSDLSAKLAAFEHGADDYLTKPFALAEVDARVRALLARSRRGPLQDPVRQCGA